MTTRRTYKEGEESVKSLKQKIKEDLLKTGFPLEVGVSNVLNLLDWNVISSSLYIDPDTGNTRELDVKAIKIHSEHDQKQREISLFSHLVIQCKKSSRPWVFFDNGGEKTFWLGFYSLKSTPDDFMSELCFRGSNIGFNQHRYKDVKLHRSFSVSFIKPSQTSPIYEAMISVCKALTYLKNQYVGNNTAHFFTPIIVLEGSLWSATLKKDSKIGLKQVNELIVSFDYIFGDDKKPSKHQYQLIEVVTYDHFKKMLSKIEEDDANLFKCWQRYIQLKEGAN